MWVAVEVESGTDLPRRPVERRTVGRVFAGRYRPSTFLTLTLDSYRRVDSDGAAVDPDRYDYRRASRDAIHTLSAAIRGVIPRVELRAMSNCQDLWIKIF